MKSKTMAWVAIAVIAILLIVVVILLIGRGKEENTGGVATGAAGTNGQTSGTRAPVPENVVVPDQGAQAPAGVAVPQLEAVAGKSTGSQYRSFIINIQNGQYDPSNVIVNQGDIVDLELTSTGGNYGFAQPDYGYNVSIPNGKTQRIQFQATNQGKFTFYCASCGGPAKGPVGYLIVK